MKIKTYEVEITAEDLRASKNISDVITDFCLNLLTPFANIVSEQSDEEEDET